MLKDQTMNKLTLIFALALVSTGTRGDFSCPNGLNAACLDAGDTVCPASTKCVDDDLVCFDKHICDSGSGLICESEYDKVLNDYKVTVEKYNNLTSVNVALREQRLEQKNCVINATTLEGAKRCVR
jgi:hypothetical protein